MTPSNNKQLEDLQAVLEVTRCLAATTDLDMLLPAIERAARQVLHCQRATVFLYDHARDELYSRIATGAREIRFSAELGISGHVVRTGQSVNVPDAYADPRFNPRIDRETGFQTRTILAVPMYDYSGQLMGVLQALNKIDGAFSQYDEWVAVALSAQAGVALQRHKLLVEYAAKQKMQRDMDIARSIQQQILPGRAPTIPGFDIAGWNRPADETGGDYYDFFERADGSLVVTVADATGHGIGPALLMAECRALLRASLGGTTDLPEAVTKVNHLLCQDLPPDRFVTAFVALIHPKRGQIDYLAAGHGPAMVIRLDGSIEQYDSTGLPLGILPDVRFSTVQPIHLQPGDTLAIVTDGMFEENNTHGEEFGLDRLGQTLSRHRTLPAGQIIEKAHEQLREFAAGQPQKDDLTTVIVKRT